MNKNLIFTLISIPTVALATMPTPPTLNDLSNGAACKLYASRMSDYLKKEKAGNVTDLLNSAWFSRFAENYSASSYIEKCANGVCIVQYDGNDSGCYIASVAKSQPINELMAILTTAYNNAINSLKIADSGSYGFTGPLNTCTIQNQYQDCHLMTRNR